MTLIESIKAMSLLEWQDLFFNIFIYGLIGLGIFILLGIGFGVYIAINSKTEESRDKNKKVKNVEEDIKNLLINNNLFNIVYTTFTYVVILMISIGLVGYVILFAAKMLNFF